MPPELQVEAWRALMTGSLLILVALVSYIVSILSRLKREQDARALKDEQRDVQRAEVQENVRRIMNGHGVALTEPPLLAVADSTNSSGGRKVPEAPIVSPPNSLDGLIERHVEAEDKPEQPGGGA